MLGPIVFVLLAMASGEAKILFRAGAYKPSFTAFLQLLVFVYSVKPPPFLLAGMLFPALAYVTRRTAVWAMLATVAVILLAALLWFTRVVGAIMTPEVWHLFGVLGLLFALAALVCWWLWSRGPAPMLLISVLAVAVQIALFWWYHAELMRLPWH